MRTEAQNQASRQNGGKSTGPKTPEGKAISSMNALRHGLTAKAILLTNENPEAYTKLADAYYEKFQPADDVERDLVDTMVISPNGASAATGPTKPPCSTSKWTVKPRRSTPSTPKSTTPAVTPWPSAPCRRIESHPVIHPLRNLPSSLLLQGLGHPPPAPRRAETEPGSNRSH